MAVRRLAHRVRRRERIGSPLGVPLRGPMAGEIGERLAEVQEWAAEWERAGAGPLRVEYKKVGGRQVGANMIPCRAWIDGYEQRVGTARRARGGTRLRFPGSRNGGGRCPRLVPWLTRRPVQVLRLADRWDQLLATVAVDRRAAVARNVPAAGRRARRGHQVHRAPPRCARRTARPATCPGPDRRRRDRLRRAVPVPPQARLRAVPRAGFPRLQRAVRARRRVHRAAAGY